MFREARLTDVYLRCLYDTYMYICNIFVNPLNKGLLEMIQRRNGIKVGISK